jgi:transposase
MEPHAEAKEPTVSSTSMPRRGVTHLGLDVAKNSIAVGVLRPGEEAVDVEKISHDEESIRRLVERFPNAKALRACYEAGPTGYELHRLLERLGVACDVVAPSLIPTAPGDKVKTDRRDARRLARLHRAGELVAIRVPTPAEEGVRDLCRARQVAVRDRRRARQRLSSFLLRHSVVWREGEAWTMRHEAWLASRTFEDPAVARAFSFYRSEVIARDATVEAMEAELRPWFTHDLFADTVRRLGAYRGLDHLGALVLAAEVCDWRRFAGAGVFMGFSGLTPTEYSSGERTRRGHITHAGNVHVRTQLVESAWSYRYGPNLSVAMKRRQEGLAPEVTARAWAAQQRMCRRFKALGARKDSTNTVVAAIARELAGFVWAEMTA